MYTFLTSFGYVRSAQKEHLLLLNNRNYLLPISACIEIPECFVGISVSLLENEGSEDAVARI